MVNTHERQKELDQKNLIPSDAINMGKFGPGKIGTTLKYLYEMRNRATAKAPGSADSGTASHRK